MDSDNESNDLFNKHDKFLDDYISKYENSDNETTLSDQYGELEFNHSAKPFADVQYDRRLDSMHNPFGSYTINKHQDFTHNNMMPQYASATYGQDNPSISSRKIELFNGLDSNPQYKKKHEVKPLFSPDSKREEFINGMPTQTDFMKTRYIPSDKRQGERPFEQTRVGPGLNLGYNQQSTHGYQDLYRALPKNIDELRPESRPKVSYKSEIVQAGLHGNRRRQNGKVDKYKQDAYYEINQDSLMPTFNERAAPAIYGVFRNDPTNRVNETKTLNPAKSIIDKHTPEGLQQKNRSSNRISYETDGPRNIAYDTKGTNTSKSSYNPSDTNRMRTENNKHITNTTGNKFMMNLTNLYNLMPDLTKRQLTENNQITNIGHHFKSYLHNSINNIQDETLRNIIENNLHITNAIGNSKNGQLFNHDNNIRDQNNRNQSEDTIIINALSNHQQSYLFNHLDNIPDLTLRNLVDKIWNTNLTGNKTQSYLFDSDNAIPEHTVRNMTEHNIHNTNFKGSKNHEYLLNYDNAIPDITLREFVENNIHVTNQTNNKQYKLFDFNNAIPDITNRDEETKNITGAIGKDSLKMRAIQEFENALLNESKNSAQYKLSLRKPITVEKHKDIDSIGGRTNIFTNYTLKDDAASINQRVFMF